MRDLPPDLPQSVVQAHEHARANGLIYVSDAEPGIERQKRGKGFHYLGPDMRPVRAHRTLDRIRKLAIPPAYTQVWICTKERGHLQATGRDARRRKQYRYHAEWRSTRDDGKFSKMIEFGAQLPKLRRRLKQDLALPGLPKNKVLAVIVGLLDGTLIRVGNEEYARTNQSYGLTTLRDKHVKFLRDGRALFNFRGKSGRQHEVVLDDRKLGRIIRHCQQLPGQQLFQYIDDEGKRQPIDSGMVQRVSARGDGRQQRFHRQGFPDLGRHRASDRLSLLPDPQGADDPARFQWLRRRYRTQRRRGARQHAGRLPQVVYQSSGVRSLEGRHRRKASATHFDCRRAEWSWRRWRC